MWMWREILCCGLLNVGEMVSNTKNPVCRKRQTGFYMGCV